jgi:hypothetical protein
MRAERPDARELKALKRGHLAEYRAALCLMVKGYRIVAMRYRTRLGEIDIIARRADLITCVEVKAQSSFDGAVFAVSNTAQAASDAVAPGGFSPPLCPLRHRRRHALAAAPAESFLTKQANL